MINEVVKDTVLNASILSVIAFLLTKVPEVRRFVSGAPKDIGLRVKLEMAVLFGCIGILSTYLGTPVQGAVANTRVIGVLVGGLLGGPVVGIGAAIIAGTHRFLIDIGGFTAVACGVSTVVEGILGGLFHKQFKRIKSQRLASLVIGLAAEFLQMGIILLLAKPFDMAWQLVQVIGLPMIIINAMGTVIFISILDSVLIEQEQEAARRIRDIMNVADQCLPYMRKGLGDRENLARAAELIHKGTGVEGVVITDREKIQATSGLVRRLEKHPQALSRSIEETLATGEVQIVEEQAKTPESLAGLLRGTTMLSAPLTFKGGEIVGTLTLITSQYQLSADVERDFASGLAKIFSTQLELSQIEYQKKLLRRAEIAALQSQIDPHFLFNALSTIAAFCREKPERARELLIVLSNYLRGNLNSQEYMITLEEELEHVRGYLELEQARFEEMLEIKWNIPTGIDCIVPRLSLQPLVENAVKHGAMASNKKGVIEISVENQESETIISIADNGSGIPSEICEQLENGGIPGNRFGMTNVHKRLKSIYGDEYGLKIYNIPPGTLVQMIIPKKIEKGESDEIFSD